MLCKWGCGQDVPEDQFYTHNQEVHGHARRMPRRPETKQNSHFDSESRTLKKIPGTNERCTATNRDGEQCKQYVYQDNKARKCYYHGGKALKGPDNPAYKHGRYSSYVPANIAGKYAAAMTDPDLLNLRSEIALMDVQIQDKLESIAKGDPSDVNWDKIVDLIDSRRKLVDSEARRLNIMNQYMTAEQIMGLLASVVTIIRSYVTDGMVLAAISRDITALIKRQDVDRNEPASEPYDSEVVQVR